MVGGISNNQTIQLSPSPSLMLTAESVRPSVLLLPLCHISIRMHTICHNLGRGSGHMGMNLRWTSLAEVFPDLLTLS